MSRHMLATMVYVCFVASVTVSAQSPTASPTRIQALVLEISIVEIIGAKPDEIDRISSSRDQLSRLVSEGKAKLTATLQVRTRAGEGFSAKVGQRLPIQTAFFPTFRTREETPRGASQAPPPDTGFAVPQLQYESTGLSVEGSSMAIVDGTIDIRFNIEMSGLDTSTGRLTPTFTMRSLKSVVRMRQGETATPIVLLQQEPPPPTRNNPNAAGTPDLPRGSFIVLLSIKPVQ